MRASSTDLKERLVRAAAEGQPMREAARRFGVAVTTAKRAVVRQRKTGSLARKPIPGGSRKIGRKQEAILRARMEATPDATVLEHRAWWEEHQLQQLSDGFHYQRKLTLVSAPAGFGKTTLLGDWIAGCM